MEALVERGAGRPEDIGCSSGCDEYKQVADVTGQAFSPVPQDVRTAIIQGERSCQGKGGRGGGKLTRLVA